MYSRFFALSLLCTSLALAQSSSYTPLPLQQQQADNSLDRVEAAPLAPYANYVEHR